MSEIKEEKSINNYPIPATIECTNKILNQLKNCICKIENKNGIETGFFYYVSYKNEKLKVLITNNKIINEEIIKENKTIKVSINDGKEYKIIELENKKIYINKKYEITIIEIKEKDNINNFLELDDEINNNRNIYILQYQKYLDGQRATVSYGIINNIENEYNIIYYSYRENDSLGLPILNLKNNKIIGINNKSIKNYNKGRFIFF